MKRKNYINNIDFADTLEVWINGGGEPPIPDYVAECFLKIVKKYGTKRNFSGYSYIEDMKSEALEHCIKYANRFNTKKSRNAFSYFTQIVHNAFLQYMNKEKKYANFKFDLTRDSLENAHKLDYNNVTTANPKEKEK